MTKLKTMSLLKVLQEVRISATYSWSIFCTSIVFLALILFSISLNLCVNELHTKTLMHFGYFLNFLWKSFNLFYNLHTLLTYDPWIMHFAVQVCKRTLKNAFDVFCAIVQKFVACLESTAPVPLLFQCADLQLTLALIDLSPRRMSPLNFFGIALPVWFLIGVRIFVRVHLVHLVFMANTRCL